MLLKGRYFYLFVYLVMVLFRVPNLLISPRFWAEEGTIYYKYAYDNSFIDALFKVHLGYYSLFSNLSGIIASWFPMLYAPVVTSFLALLIQLIPALLILFGKSTFWNSLPKQVLGLLVVLFINPSGEIWLNSINSQFVLALVVFLFLIDEYPKKLNLFKYGMLILAGFTGIISCFLTGLYFIRWIFNRQKEFLIPFVILAITSAIQMAIIYFNLEESSERLNTISLSLFSSIVWIKSILTYLFKPVTIVFREVLMDYKSYGLLWGTLVILFLILVSYKMDLQRKLIFVGSFLSVIVLSIIGALGDKENLLNIGINTRYFYLPNAILAFSLLYSIYQTDFKFNLFLKRPIAEYFLILFFSLGMINGGIYYFKVSEFYQTGPEWEEEVQDWEENHKDNLKVWPKQFEFNVEETGK
ncbi:MAG: hypothetical protein H6604_04890 [Flavobacteriales bacterium]|nr:hypothetical protein [Flavobacteriales bacterium]